MEKQPILNYSTAIPSSSQSESSSRLSDIEHVVDEEASALTRRMAAGNEAAYGRFFREYYTRLCAYANRLTSGNEAVTQDLVQETLLRVVRYIRPMGDADELWCWLVLLLRCVFLDAVRKEKRYHKLLESYSVNLELNVTPIPISLKNSESLHHALQRLRKCERKLLLDKYRDESSHSEMAASLGISEKAVESRVARLRTKLKSYLTSSGL